MSECVGPFVLGPRLGVGGMGVVHAARDEALERTVALKLISPHLAHDDEFRARFVREARAMASLDSPHVVHVYAHGEDDGRLWIASQLVPDGDLGTLLRRSGAPPLPLALDLVAQVASGLADAHAAGLVHRDIKPANVLLRRTGATYTAYLADFGIARRAGGDLAGFTQGVVGTPSYMAPELHTGGAAGVTTDVYSLGCLLWSTLVGHAPYGGTSDFQIVSAHLDQPVPQLGGDSPVVHEVNRVLRTAMAKDPSKRYPDAASVRDDLRRIQRLATEGPTVVRPGAAPPVSPPGARPPASAPVTAGRRGAIAAGVVAAALVLGVAVVTWLVLPSGDSPGGRDPGGSAASSSGTEPTGPTEPTESAPTSPTSPTAPPSPPEPPPSPSAAATDPPPEGYTDDDRLVALQGFVAALRTQPTIGRKSANCIASGVMGQMGLDGMVEAGFFDESLTFIDQDLSDRPDVRVYFTNSTLACMAGI